MKKDLRRTGSNGLSEEGLDHKEGPDRVKKDCGPGRAKKDQIAVKRRKDQTLHSYILEWMQAVEFSPGPGD